VIPGWQEAIPLLKKGGKGTFIIPSGLAYGSRGAGGAIKPNTVLVFEVELIDF
jgi:FKBP-type peptidyl-prolyl cis-trans isomerase